MINNGHTKKYLIAIDPDADKSGVAVLDTEKREFAFVGSLPFVDTINKVREYQEDTSKVIVEAGWLVSHNWHVNKWMTASVCAKIGQQTGRNHETGRKLIECINGLLSYAPVCEHRPLVKKWSGKEGKITAKELEFFTGYSKRSNQDQRDAMLLAWYCAGLPIRVCTKKNVIDNHQFR